MKNTLKLAIALLLMSSGAALAQSTATPVVTGYLTTIGCAPGFTSCFVQYGGGGSGSGPPPYKATLVPLDISTVTTGGTAVTALNAGHRTAGGFLLNPIGATINLCINEQATASGTTSSGALTCITPGQTYFLTPSTLAVSVITSDSSHPFAGPGLQ